MRLKDISSCHISFTIGASGAEYKKNGSIELLTMEDIKKQIIEYGNNFDAFMKATGRHYIEAHMTLFSCIGSRSFYLMRSSRQPLLLRERPQRHPYRETAGV